MLIQGHDGTLTFAVRVSPRASRDAIEGEHDGALKVRLTAPPVDDKANQALCRLLAARLNGPVSTVKIDAGGKNRNKRVAVVGTTKAQIEAVVALSPVRS